MPNRRKNLELKDNREYVPNRKSNVECKSCGRRHSQEDMCVAANRQCYECFETGHFARCCKAKKRAVVDNKFLKEVGEIKTAEEGTIHYNDNAWFVNVVIANKNLKFMVDTGSQISLIPRRTYESLNIQLQKTSTTLEHCSNR